MSGFGEAGKRGPRVRSDCWISVALKSSGGLTIDLKSKVAGMFGDRIMAQIEEGCGGMGLTDAEIAVEDQGALPFTIAARLETAVRRAGGKVPRGLVLVREVDHRFVRVVRS